MLAALVDAITLFAYAHLLVIISVQQASLNIKMSNILGGGPAKNSLLMVCSNSLQQNKNFHSMYVMK